MVILIGEFYFFPLPSGAFCDLVWSDPEDVETWTISPRGAGWLFGHKVTFKFMDINDLKLICRAHQLVHEGVYSVYCCTVQEGKSNYYVVITYRLQIHVRR